jgi:hypothetical protein
MKTTFDIELGELFDDAMDNILGEFEEAIENIRKYRPHDIVHTVDVDIHELLENEHAIALIWDTDQLINNYPHLTEDQAWETLKECERNYKAEEGLTWDDIAETVAKLYPDPDRHLMPERIARCEKALQEYSDSDEIANITDLLADLMHW